MKTGSKNPVGPLFLGIEGGATHTVALMTDAAGEFLRRFETGPANLKLLNESQLVVLLQSIAAKFFEPCSLAIGLAGARTEADYGRIRKAAGKVWPGVPCHATNDLETALATAGESNSRGPSSRVLILSGTGSCCYGRNSEGKAAKIGGWGHILGDKGSGYEIGLRALKAGVFYHDRDGDWSKLGQRLLQRLQLNEPEELVDWVQSAEKSVVASLAVEAFAAWSRGDRIANDILAGAADSLARDAVACARKLASPRGQVRFILAGSVLLKQPRFSRQVGAQLQTLWPGAVVSSLEKESVWGAVALARAIWNGQSKLKESREAVRKLAKARAPRLPDIPRTKPGKVSPTEQRNPLSLNLDRLSLAKSIELMLSEDAKVPEAILAERTKIERAVRLIVQSFRRGGRLFYIGAGTSGRLGVLDASECPPTFRTDPEMVQGIIAGGQSALWRSVEGAEDDAAAGARAVGFRGVGRRDVVVGIAASGRTPFVWGGLAEARRRGAKTVLLAFNPFLEIRKKFRPTVVITPNVGPELLTGSTRLKAGTATKLILNIFTTLAMVRLGKVAGNLMIDLNPSNAKLRDRAARIVQELQGVDYSTAQLALEKSKWIIKQACVKLRR